MSKSTSEQNIRQALVQVRHPEIARTLVELGMLKDMAITGNKVTLTLVLPFMGIPTQIKEYLINSVHQAIVKVDESMEIEVNLAEMNPEEHTTFFRMEREGWIG